jgi:two-component system, NarL family, sensor kinase
MQAVELRQDHSLPAQHPRTARASTRLSQYLQAQDEERLRMGRELHDSTGQLLLTLSLNLALLRQSSGDERTMAIIEDIDENVSQIEREIRAFSFLHYPSNLAEKGLIASLDTMTRSLALRTSLRIQFDATVDRPIEKSSAITMLRVAQEALSNVYRHARASYIRMVLSEDSRGLVLSVLDDGVGISPDYTTSSGNGVGIRGMAHRVEHLGGCLQIRRLRKGTKLVAIIPSRQRDKRAA